MNRKLYLVLLSIVLIAACRKEVGPLILSEVTSPAPVSIRLEAVTDIAELRFTRLAADQQNSRLLVYGIPVDASNKTRILFLDQGMHIVDSGELPIGQGPGDISPSFRIFPAGHLLYILDTGNRRISVFRNDAKLELLKTISASEVGGDPRYSPLLSGNYSQLAYSRMAWRSDQSSSDNVVCLSPFPRLSRAKSVIVIRSFGEFINENGQSILDNAPMTDYFFQNNELYVLDMREYSIRKFDDRGSLVKQVKMQFQRRGITDSEKKEWTEEIIGKRQASKYTLSDRLMPASWMIPLKTGFAVIRRKDYRQSATGPFSADYFDYDLKPLGKMKIPYFFRINAVRYPGLNEFLCTLHDHIYFVEDAEPNWKIKRGRVVESETRKR